MRKLIPLLALAAAEVERRRRGPDHPQARPGSRPLICGVNPDLEGFAIKDAKGQWSGFDVDFCRALAAVTFNDPSKVHCAALGLGAVRRPEE